LSDFHSPLKLHTVNIDSCTWGFYFSALQVIPPQFQQLPDII
jgi:hypothetical protein